MDVHLAECEACRATLSEMERQDAGLLRAFLPRHVAANELADRVSLMVEREHDLSARGLQRDDDRGRPRPPLAATQIGEAAMRSTGDWMQPVCDAASGGMRTSRRPTANWRLASILGLTTAAVAGCVVGIVFTRQPRTRPAGQYVVRSAPPVAQLTLATGEVFTCPSAETTWRPISPSAPIDLLAGIRTAESKCELRLPDGSCVRLNSGTDARFTGARTVSVSSGELWCAVPRNAAPLCVSSGQTSVTAQVAGSGQGTQFDLSRTGNAATVIVQRGTAEVVGNGPPATVHGGEILRAPSPSAVPVCSAAPDPLLASRWQDELLLLKPGDDPDVAVRVDQLLATIAADRETSESPGVTEQDVRRRGPVWCTPFACYIQKQPSGGEARRTAARLLADLSPPARIPDLIGLLSDSDGEVRSQAALALRRLTGQTLGYAPDRLAGAPGAATAWRSGGSRISSDTCRPNDGDAAAWQHRN